MSDERLRALEKKIDRLTDTVGDIRVSVGRLEEQVKALNKDMADTTYEENKQTREDRMRAGTVEIVRAAVYGGILAFVYFLTGGDNNG